MDKIGCKTLFILVKIQFKDKGPNDVPKISFLAIYLCICIIHVHFLLWSVYLLQTSRNFFLRDKGCFVLLLFFLV